MLDKVQLSGKGEISSAELGNRMFGWKVTLFSDDFERGKIKIGPREWTVAAVQDGEKVHLITREFVRKDGPEYVIYKYLARDVTVGNRVKSSSPAEIARFSYCSDNPKFVADRFFDGQQSKPSIVFSHPGETLGHNNSFLMEYNPATAIDLQTREEHRIIEKALAIDKTNLNGKVLVSLTVPASYVPTLLERGADPLEEVFQESDLEAVARINESKDLEHASGCWGDHSCIPRGHFEMVNVTGYPTYRISMDTKGTIYKAERVNS